MLSVCSKVTTSKPSSIAHLAAAMPDEPAPITATLFCFPAPTPMVWSQTLMAQEAQWRSKYPGNRW
jgi:hypothetical protein